MNGSGSLPDQDGNGTGLRQISLTTSAANSDRVEALMLEAGAISVTLAPETAKPVLEPGPGETPLWERVTVTGLFPSTGDLDTVRALLAAALGPGARVAHGDVPQRDWVRAWMDRFGPMQFGRRLWVCPTGASVDQEDAVVVSLDPGLAFGTGTHPTTALCLEWLDAHPPGGLEVVDFGCGSGILSLAACHLGAAGVTALDIDDQALLATRDNAGRNGIPRARLATGHPDNGISRPADLLLANILSGPLIGLRARFASMLKPGARIVLSGILHEQTSDVVAAYREDFSMLEPVIRDDWALLEGRLNH